MYDYNNESASIGDNCILSFSVIFMRTDLFTQSRV